MSGKEANPVTPSNDTFEYESIQDTQTVKDFIQSLIEGMDKGKIVLTSNGDEIELNPTTMFKFAVKAKKKGDTGKISLKISWKEQKKVNVNVRDNLEISS